MFITGFLLALSLGAPAPAPQPPDPPDQVQVVNVGDVRQLLDRPPASLALNVPRSTATFRSEARQYFKPMPTFEEYFHGIFELNTIQRQSADWTSRGFGVNLLALATGIQRAWRERQASLTRQDIALELEQLRFNNSTIVER
jgi:hypothetical protein